jgi:hypothetical protein
MNSEMVKEFTCVKCFSDHYFSPDYDAENKDKCRVGNNCKGKLIPSDTLTHEQKKAKKEIRAKIEKEIKEGFNAKYGD